MLPCARAMSGVITESVNALMRVLNARATMRPMAMTMTSPRNKKFLNPLSTGAFLSRIAGW